MKERPILFSGEMVRAILAGNKSQTRRVIQFPRKWIGIVDNDLRESGFWNTGEYWQYGDDRLPQNYQVGDRLWIRETWAIKDIARIWLEITGVRVERLQDISRDDAMFEGVELVDPYKIADIPPNIAFPAAFKDYKDASNFFTADPIHSFWSLWDSINAKRGYPWNSNPFVWVIKFERIER